MSYALIFFTAAQTAANEMVLKFYLKRLGFCFSGTFTAINVKTLVLHLEKSVKCYDVSFIIGGLSNVGSTNVIRVLSKALNFDIKKAALELNYYNLFETGCVLTKGKQSICVLPDNPNAIKTVMSSDLFETLKKTFSIRSDISANPVIQI